MNRYILTAYGKRKNLYWNGCGWTEFKKQAQVMGIAEAEEKEQRMFKDKIIANAIPA